MDVKIEKQSDGSYLAYVPDAEQYVIIGTGDSVKAAKEDFMNSLKEVQETINETDGEVAKELLSTPIFHFDLASLFEYLSFINVSGLARMLGINESLMRQYKKGDTYISDSQLNRIEEGLHSIGRTLTSLKLN